MIRTRADSTMPSREAAPASTADAPVRVAIEYCELGNHSRPARAILRALAEEFGDDCVPCDLLPASSGRFEVRVNGQLVFSKCATCRFPDPVEIFYHVAAALAGRQKSSSPECRSRGCALALR